MPLKLLILIFSLQTLRINASDCYQFLIPDTPKNYACNAPGEFTATDLQNFPLGLQKLTIAVVIQVTDLCTRSGQFNFLTVSIIPPGTPSVRKKVMMLTREVSGQITFRTEDDIGTQTAMIRTNALPGIAFNVFLSVDFTAGSHKFAVGGLMEDVNNIGTLTAADGLDYGSGWTFDSSLVISVCSDYNKVNSIGCKAQNLKVFYSIYEYTSSLDFANSVTLIGDYKLNEGKGNTLKNSKGKLASSTLHATSPTWIPDGGIQFTSGSEYIDIPGFTPSASDLAVSSSVSFIFYLKIDSAPAVGTTANIISYTCFSNSALIFKLELDSDRKIKNTIQTSSLTGGNPLSIGQWNWIYASIIYYNGIVATSIVAINGAFGLDTTPNVVPAYPSSVFSNSDQIRIGAGFIGQIRRFQVYSPGAYQLDGKSCDPTTCAFNIGYSTPPTCAQAICSTPGTYSSLSTCEKCPSACLTCTNPSTCQSCTSEYYLIGTTCTKCPNRQYSPTSTSSSCVDCPKHCSSCLDSQHCNTCDSGYGLFNNLCVLCPAGTYLSDGICKELSKGVQDALSTSQTLNSATGQAASAISKGSSISLSASVSGRIFSQIKFFDIGYSGELQVALLTWLPSFISLGLTPDMPNKMLMKIPERRVPYIFEKFEVPSSFLVNFWENLGIIVFVTVLWLLFKGIELMLSPPETSKFSSFIRKIRFFIQNFLLTALYGVYGDLVLFSILEYRSLVFGWNLSLLSFFISLIMLIAMFVAFYYQITILLSYQRIKKQQITSLEKFKKENEGSQVFFKDFKDYSLAPQLFLIFLSGRDLLISLILVTMFAHPLAQTILILILNCLMVAYLFIKRPFESLLDLVQQLFFEFISLAVGICVLINAVLDAGDYITTNSRNSIGKVVIICNLIFNFATAVFMLLMIFSLLKEAYQFYQRKKTQPRKAINLNDKTQNASVSIRPKNNIFEMSQFSNQPFTIESESQIFYQNSIDSVPNDKLHHRNDQKDFQRRTRGENIKLKNSLQGYSQNERYSLNSPYLNSHNTSLNESNIIQSTSHQQRNTSSLERKKMRFDFEEPQMPTTLKRRYRGVT